jgi:arginase
MPGTILLPYHQDERLSDRCIGLPGGIAPASVDPGLPDADQWTRLVALYDALATQVADDASSGAVTRVVTGDCLATLGTLVGLQRAGLDPALVWFDAHGDVHTVQSSMSGYLGGMALRMAVGGDFALLGSPLGLRPLAEDRAVLVDARDLDPAEVRYLSQSSLGGLMATGRVAALDIACPWFEPAADAESDQRADLLGKVLSRAG